MAKEFDQVMESGAVIKEKVTLFLDEHLISFTLIRMPGGSALIWIGTLNQPTLEINDLSLALALSSTSLLGDDPNMISRHMAERLSKRFNQNKPVYVSLNLVGIDCSNANVQLQLEQQVTNFFESALKSL